MPESTASLLQFIRDVRRRWRLRVLLRAAGRAGVVAAAPLAAVAVAWRLIALGPAAAVIAVAAGALLALGGAVLVLRQLPPRPDDRRVARFVEESVAAAGERPAFDDALVSAVAAAERSEPAQDTPFAPVIAAQALRRLDGLAPRTIVTPLALRRAALEGAGGAAALALAALAFAAPFADAAATARFRLDPGSVSLAVEPGDVRVVTGQPITVRARVAGLAGRATARVSPTLVVSAGGQQREVTMTRDGDGFAFAFESVDRTFDYEVRLGGAKSGAYTITALNLPRVTRIDAHYEYPRFTALPPRDETDAGDLYAPKGTRVRLTVHADKPLAAGRLKLGTGDGPTSMRVTGERAVEADLLLTAHDSYRLTLLDRDGLDADAGTEYFIRLVDDRPPDVRIVRPGGDQKITPLEEVSIEARADDDFGVASLELVYTLPGGKEQVVPFERLDGTPVARVGSRQLHAEVLGLEPGDVVSYYARARDVARGKPATTATSDLFFLEVRPFNEEFVLAQSQAMAGQGDPQVESLIDAQKQIIAATWNLERRSGAGKSAEDIAALAAAQAELKGRAERLIGRGPARSFEEFPQQIGFVQPRRRPGGVAAVAEAAAAMGKAAGELEGQRTRSAIPHEMAALQGLMQAQAEIRRRQVAQQQASAGSGGSGRQGQDLSALFDKELQRQQRTNYETRAQVETRPDAPERDDALERIRELARRQEALARQQRELADAELQAQEERRLEQLQREQARLQEQAEQLQRQMQQRSGQPSRAQGQGQPSAGRGGASQGAAGQTAGMSRALEQMRRAADSLQNRSAAEAAASGARAADQLRQLEQQMSAGRRDDPAKAETAAGELRMEAHQIAEAQRRVAAEAERLEREGGGAADALRRLAGEKDRLADRVETLQRRAEAMAGERGAAGAARTPADAATQAGAEAAARSLREGRLEQRMRDTAEAMRRAAQAGTPSQASAGGRQAATPAGQTAGPALGAAEQQLAEALAGVARRLGAPEKGEAGQLAAQLEESRAVRDRLDRLERQIREAEGRAQQEANRAGANQPSAGRAGETRVDELRQQYARELQRARELAQQGAAGRAAGGAGGATPEQHEWSTSAPGNEAFKQDFAAWDALRKDVDVALERYEAGLSARLVKSRAEDRLSGGGGTRTADAYDAAVARYYESLARPRK